MEEDKLKDRESDGTFGPGNQYGAIRKQVSITRLIKKKLEGIGPDEKREVAEHLVDNIMQDALDGKNGMDKLVWNYIDGMPKQSTEISGELNLPQPIADVRANDGLQEDQPTEEED